MISFTSPSYTTTDLTLDREDLGAIAFPTTSALKNHKGFDDNKDAGGYDHKWKGDLESGSFESFIWILDLLD